MKDDKNLHKITVYARISPNSLLRDTRYTSYCYVFGRVKDVARQYGIKLKVKDTCVEFSAPKSRMQMFVEKLHFAGIPFSERPI